MTWITGPNLSQFFISGKKKKSTLTLFDGFTQREYMHAVSPGGRIELCHERPISNSLHRVWFYFILFFVFKRNRPKGRVIHPTKRRRRKKPKRVDAMSFMVSILSSNYTSEELCDSCLLHIDHDQNIEPKIVSHVDSHKSYCVGWQTWNQSTRNQ